jgi:hypothetical protein
VRFTSLDLLPELSSMTHRLFLLDNLSSAIHFLPAIQVQQLPPVER